MGLASLLDASLVEGWFQFSSLSPSHKTSSYAGTSTNHKSISIHNPIKTQPESESLPHGNAGGNAVAAGNSKSNSNLQQSQTSQVLLPTSFQVHNGGQSHSNKHSTSLYHGPDNVTNNGYINLPRKRIHNYHTNRNPQIESLLKPTSLRPKPTSSSKHTSFYLDCSENGALEVMPQSFRDFCSEILNRYHKRVMWRDFTKPNWRFSGDMKTKKFR
jgi:hypothetical protein